MTQQRFPSEFVYCTLHLVKLTGMELYQDELNTVVIATVHNAITN